MFGILLKAQFVDPSALVPEDMVAGAINGMLDTLGDQGHTRYLTAEQVKRFAEDLEKLVRGHWCVCRYAGYGSRDRRAD